MSYYTRYCPDGMTLREFAAQEADPEPHPGEPPCGHDECDTAWKEDNCMEDRLDDWGDGSCIEVYKWEVHIAPVRWLWCDHPVNQNGFEGTPDEAREFLRSVRGRSRLWPLEDQRETDEDLVFCKKEE